MCAFARTPFWESQKEKRIGYFFCQKKSLIENNAYCASYFSPGLTVYFIGLYFTIMTLFHGGKNLLFFTQRKYCNGGKHRKKGINDIKWQTVSSRSITSFEKFLFWRFFSNFFSLVAALTRGLLNIFSLFCILSALKNSSFITCDNFLHKYLHTVTIKLQYLIFWWWCK